MGHYDSCYENQDYYDSAEWRRECQKRQKEAAERAAQAKLDREEFRERMRRILVH
jgi:hypothetical protein